MRFLRFVFPFLFTRNWHSGSQELSRPRVVLFATMLLLIALIVLVIAIMQQPVVYSG